MGNSPETNKHQNPDYRPVEVLSRSFDSSLNLLRTQDFSLAASSGKISGLATIHKFGKNTTVGATHADVWSAGGLYTGWLTAAVAMRVKAGGNAADDNDGGAGARTITVEGLDANWNAQTDTLTLAGASASAATTNTYIRIYRAKVALVGTYTGSNTGDVDIETTGGVLMARIGADIGQTEMTMYSVPSGKTAYITQVHGHVDSKEAADIHMHIRENANDVTSPFTGSNTVMSFTQVKESLHLPLTAYPKVPEMSDLWFASTGGASGTSVAVHYGILLQDN